MATDDGVANEAGVPGRQLRTPPAAVIGFLAGVDELRFRPATNWAVQAVTQAAADHGFAMVLGLDSERPNAALRNLAASGNLAGLIVRPSACDRAWVKELIESEAPAVLMGTDRKRSDVHSVDTENLESTSQLVGSMIDRGCERLAMVTGPASADDAADRRAGFELAHQQRGLSVDDGQFYEGGYNRKLGYEVADEVFGNGHDGVFAANDESAYGVFYRAQERGFDIPGDLMLAGFDGTAGLEFGGRSMATVHQPFDELGVAVVETLRWLIAGVDVPLQRRIDPTISFGDTLRPL